MCGFVHLLILEQTIRGYLLGDLVALIGNIDCVFGSIGNKVFVKTNKTDVCLLQNIVYGYFEN